MTKPTLNTFDDDFHTTGGYQPRFQDEINHTSSRTVRYHPYSMPISRFVPDIENYEAIGRQKSPVKSIIPFSLESFLSPVSTPDSGIGTTPAYVEERESTPSAIDCSMTSLDSLSPASVNTGSSTSSPYGSERLSGSTSGSPKKDAESAHTSDKESDGKPQKGARTKYTKEQLKTLMKIFHENPYPDSEMMENIANDFGVKDTNIKIWFQNKRARWRRRVENMNNSTQSHMLHATPVPSQMHPYIPICSNFPGMPLSYNSGYMYYPWMQTGTLSTNNSTQQQITLNQLPTRQISPTMAPTSFAPYYNIPSPMTTSLYPTPAATYPVMTSPQESITANMNRHLSHSMHGTQNNPFVC
ncbi:hypothetical protein DPMN_081726 [Dreissena polymorpha]|uniref:Homeobox domain-containing protein n=1 Tax=Dreissena polymorpha TaxID=45954 RepID=A0A9D3Y8N0_DREPO|nr:hypothetical protein DPMN_081726 [Dreissena polymorpha]